MLDFNRATSLYFDEHVRYEELIYQRVCGNLSVRRRVIWVLKRAVRTPVERVESHYFDIFLQTKFG